MLDERELLGMPASKLRDLRDQKLADARQQIDRVGARAFTSTEAPIMTNS